jgi:hypothetical protein
VFHVGLRRKPQPRSLIPARTSAFGANLRPRHECTQARKHASTEARRHEGTDYALRSSGLVHRGSSPSPTPPRRGLLVKGRPARRAVDRTKAASPRELRWPIHAWSTGGAHLAVRADEPESTKGGMHECTNARIIRSVRAEGAQFVGGFLPHSAPNGLLVKDRPARKGRTV